MQSYYLLLCVKYVSNHCHPQRAVRKRHFYCALYFLMYNKNMLEQKEKQNTCLQRWWKLCPLRHILCIAGLLLIFAYFALRRQSDLMNQLSEHFVRPWHRFFSKFFAPIPFSVGEALIVLGIICAIVYITFFIVRMIRQPEKGTTLYRFAITCLAAFSLIYGGFCLLWGVYYDCSDFEDQSGIHGVPLSTEQLITVTHYFTRLLGEYDAQIERDENGLFCEDLDSVFADSATLYNNAAAKLPCLAGDEVPAKPFFLSRMMSYINFTGFFFPFTGESNINVDVPPALIPSTIAHELAHQRGIAQEDEANFAAVFASLESGDPVYSYSACLMAYIYLGNALHRDAYDVWRLNYEFLPEGARADLAANTDYWAQFETPVSAVSDKVYTGFLQSYGQTDGLKTYGKCVDLLVAYYYNIALEAFS